MVGRADLIRTKFKIGDKVILNKTGPINIGTISAISFCGAKHISDNHKGWLTYYPDCWMYPVYYILLDNPNKSMTEEEYILGQSYKINQLLTALPPTITDKYLSNIFDTTNVREETVLFLKEAYKNVPVIYSLTAPEQDLSLVDYEKVIDELIGQKDENHIPDLSLKS